MFQNVQNVQGKILHFDLFLTIAKTDRLTRFLVLHVQCSVNSYVERKEILMDKIFRSFVYVIFRKSSEQI